MYYKDVWPTITLGWILKVLAVTGVENITGTPNKPGYPTIPVLKSFPLSTYKYFYPSFE